MAYDRSYWKDHVTDQSGEVIQQGTLLDQQHFNNMELGISDMTLAGAIMQFKAVQDGYNYADEMHTAKDTRESLYRAIPTSKDNDKTGRVATGTGPVTWSHDGTLEGIWDLNGNVWEWCAGLRLVKGEVQVIADNNAAAPTCDMSASSAAWKAISAATGELVAPDGNGTTQGTVKLDFISGKWTYSTTIAHTTGANGCSFKDVTCDSSIGAAAKLLLQALAMLPDAALTGDGIDATYGGDYFYINNAEAERCLIRGGYWLIGGNAGVFSSYLYIPRSHARGSIGGRSAFYE